MVHACNPELERLKQEYQKFEACLGSSKPAWAT
jgi:hypothetical protein